MKRVVIFLFVILFSVTFAFAGEPISGAEEDGASDIITDSPVSDTQTQQPLVKTIDRHENLEGKSFFFVGSSMLYGKYVKNINLPLSYTMGVNFLNRDGYLTFSLNIPYTMRKMKDYSNNDVKESGLGDISISTNYFTKLSDSWLISPQITVKFPTGKMYDDSDIPLGTGSYDFGFSIWAEKSISKFDLDFLFGYIVKGTYTYDLPDTVPHSWEYHYGNVINGKFSLSYAVNEPLSLTFSFLFQRTDKTEIKDIYNGSPMTPSNLVGLTKLDTGISATYSLYAFDINAGVIIPITYDWVGDDKDKPKDYSKTPPVNIDPEKTVKIKVSVSYPLSF